MNDFPGSSEDERMRQLLDDAVSDVEPRDSRDSIRSRTVVTPFRSKRPWILGAGAAVVATAATVAAVAVMGGNPGTTGAQDPGFAGPSGAPPSAEGSGMPDPDKSSAPDEEPAPSGMSSDESSAASPELVTVPVYYVGDTSRGPRLFREFHRVQSNGDHISQALNEAVQGTAFDKDYRSDWPTGTVADFGFDGIGDDGFISIRLTTEAVDLRKRPPEMSPEQAALAIEQLIYTAQAATQSRATVEFYLNGERSTSETVLGVRTSEPLSEGDPASVLALVWVIDPAEGARVQSPFKVSGLANAFEANVQWELMQGDAVVENGFTTARECCVMAPYSFKVNAPPGDYTLVVHDSDPSDGEGFAPWQDTKNITVVE